MQACWLLASDLMGTGSPTGRAGAAGAAGSDGDAAGGGGGGGDGVIFRPGDFNQSLMELGATLCSPTTPTCQICPLQSVCRAYKEVNDDDLDLDVGSRVDSESTTTTSDSSSSSSSSSSFSSSSSSSFTRLTRKRRRVPHIVIDYAENEEERKEYGIKRATVVRSPVFVRYC